jgi:hypothetical protein
MNHDWQNARAILLPNYLFNTNQLCRCCQVNHSLKPI